MTETEKIRDDLYVKKDRISGYRVVHPIKKDITKPFGKGNINWFNLLTGGTWWNLIKAFLVLGAILLLVVSYKHDVAAYKEIADKCLSDPCEWCRVVNSVGQSNDNRIQFNMTAIQEAIRGGNQSG